MAGFSVTGFFAEGFFVEGFFVEGLAARLAFTVFLTVFLAGVLTAALTLPRRADFFAVAARLVPALALALSVDFVLAFALDFRLAAFDAFVRLPLRAFLVRATEGFAFERALERDAVAALDLLDLFLAMMVAAGKGFRRASQSEVMI